MIRPFAAALVACLMIACTPAVEAPAPVPPVPTPAFAPVVLRGEARNVSFLDLAGGTHALEEYRGKFVVLAFFAHWCPVCQGEMPILQGFADKYKDKNVAVVALEATGAPQDVVSDFKTHYAAGLPFFLDPSQIAPDAYLVRNFPTIYLVSPDFVVQEKLLGRVPADYLEGRYALYSQVAGAPSAAPSISQANHP